MIFVSEIHGVGKDYFSKELEKKLGIKSYSASELIKKTRKIEFRRDMKTSDIEENQEALIEAVAKNNYEQYILNGHFCLLNSKGKIERIPMRTFYLLNPEKIIILKEKPEIITARRAIRDKVEISVEEIKEFQKEELDYGREVAKSLRIPILIINPKEEFYKAINFINISKNREINL